MTSVMTLVNIVIMMQTITPITVITVTGGIPMVVITEIIMSIIIIIDMKTMITIIEPTRVKTMQEKMLGEQFAIRLCK